MVNEGMGGLVVGDPGHDLGAVSIRFHKVEVMLQAPTPEFDGISGDGPEISGLTLSGGRKDPPVEVEVTEEDQGNSWVLISNFSQGLADGGQLGPLGCCGSHNFRCYWW